MTNQIERFWSNVAKGWPSECWTWTKGCDRDGYGFVSWNGVIKRCHRIAYQLANNVTLTSSQQVLHSCDNPPCCNPAHLFIGTQLDNNNDKVLKNRHCYGIFNANAKFTEDQIREIRKIGHIWSQREIAEMYSTTQTTISKILSRRLWGHVTD